MFYFLLVKSYPVKQYRFPVNEVNSCPTTNQSWYEAGVQLNCTYDKNNRFQYMCIPNQAKTALLEFCYDYFIRLHEKGHCLHLTDSGTVNEDSCKSFNDGCPYRPYLSNNIFLFQRCLNINKQLGCFIDDPQCPLVNQRH
ncbi:uncharacterized protein LOC134257835 [Saccostrea cucullata]|uniref:uncharacterized protein LOC134257835 n=1 Tax=Saccostrea cuccullata TaxID=36930 RepID=UPI002ED470C9